MIQAAFKQAGLSGEITLKSIRASVVQEFRELYEPLEVIKSRTGNSSDKAVTQYMRHRDMNTQIRVVYPRS